MTDPNRQCATKAAANAFVLEHYDIITRYSRSIASKHVFDVDDVFSHAAELILSRFHTFDPERGTVKTFIYWQVMRSVTELKRQAGRGRMVTCGMNPAEPDLITTRPSRCMVNATEDRAIARILLSRELTIIEKEALQSRFLLPSIGEEEHVATYGYTTGERRRRIRNLRNRLSKRYA